MNVCFIDYMGSNGELPLDKFLECGLEKEADWRKELSLMHSQQFCFLPVSQHFFLLPPHSNGLVLRLLLWVWKRKVVFRTRFFKKEMFFKVFIYLLWAALDLHCSVWTFSSWSKRGLLSSCGAGVSHCGGFSCCRAQAWGMWASGVAAPKLWSSGSVVGAHDVCCPATWGIFLDQGSNSCLLPWQADS